MQRETSKRNVLLVEDLEDDVFLLQRAFKKAEIPAHLRILNDGESAIRYLKGEPPYENRKLFPLPELIILDLKLPKKNGFEVLTWIRQQPKLKHIPVLILSSSDVHPDVNRAYQLGANSFLVKPFAIEKLQEMIESMGKYWLEFNELPTPEI